MAQPWPACAVIWKAAVAESRLPQGESRQVRQGARSARAEHDAGAVRQPAEAADQALIEAEPTRVAAPRRDGEDVEPHAVAALEGDPTLIG